MNDSAWLRTHYLALTEGVGVSPLSGRTLLEVRGSDRTQFLNGFCTNNIKAVAPGQGCEAFVTSPQGKTLGHVLVFCEPDRLWLDTSPGQAAALIAHFDKYVISEDVQFVDRSAETGLLLVAGKQAGEVLSQLTGQEPPSTMLAAARGKIGEFDLRLARVPYVPDGYFVWLAPRDVVPALEPLMQAGAVLCTIVTVEAARIAAGFPLFGSDISEDNLPQEVGRDAQAISFTKGCYLGQETVARIDALGHVNKKLVGLKFGSADPPLPNTPLMAGDKEVGRVTSAAWSPALNAPLALGYVRTIHARPGTPLVSAIGSAEIVKLPVESR